MNQPNAMKGMIWTAWNSGSHSPSGVGYGFKIAIRDRDLYIDTTWKTVTVELPVGDGYKIVELNVDKPSFWGKHCHELLSKEFGMWLLNNGRGRWQNRKPPKMHVSIMGPGKFRIESGFAE
jgi:hypothetical protein